MNIATILLSERLVVMRTDTIYGILGLAASESAVNHIYEAKGRDFTKPCILLVSHVERIPGLTTEQHRIYSEANNIRPTSLVVPASDEPSWVTRGGSSVAYRVCAEPKLQQILKQTGPVIAPSANPQGKPPACNIEQARAYFGHAVACYVDGGYIDDTTPPSQIVAFRGSSMIRLAR